MRSRAVLPCAVPYNLPSQPPSKPRINSSAKIDTDKVLPWAGLQPRDIAMTLEVDGRCVTTLTDNTRTHS